MYHARLHGVKFHLTSQMSLTPLCQVWAIPTNSINKKVFLKPYFLLSRSNNQLWIAQFFNYIQVIWKNFCQPWFFFLFLSKTVWLCVNFRIRNFRISCWMNMVNFQAWNWLVKFHKLSLFKYVKMNNYFFILPTDLSNLGLRDIKRHQDLLDLPKCPTSIRFPGRNI